MSSFDQRAEASAERGDRRRGRGAPTPAQLRAVRKALASRHRQIEGHLETIDTMFKLGGRGNPDFGPSVPGSRDGEIAVDRMGKVADELRRTSKAVAAVNFPAADKQKLTAALTAAAKSWDARAKMTRTTDPAAAEAALKKAGERDAEAARLGRPVMEYFGEVQR